MRKLIATAAPFVLSDLLLTPHFQSLASLRVVTQFDASPPDEKTITEAYLYLLGRALVIRQERHDLAEPGVGYNIIKYNPLGSADFVNPNLDVAYLEAWIAVDERAPAVLEVPAITGRYAATSHIAVGCATPRPERHRIDFRRARLGAGHHCRHVPGR